MTDHESVRALIQARIKQGNFLAAQRLAEEVISEAEADLQALSKWRTFLKDKVLLDLQAIEGASQHLEELCDLTWT